MRSDSLQFEMAGSTHTGMLRNENQDKFGVFPELNLAAICDGMGGHSRGLEASEMAVKIAQQVFSSEKMGRHSDFLSELPLLLRPTAAHAVWSWWIANQVLYQTGQTSNAARLMGTTGTLLCLHPAAVIISHVGDSRVYRLRGRDLQQLTTDHSWMNELLLDKEISSRDIKKFKAKNVITRALGLGPQLRIDLNIMPWEPGDLFLLTTDGLTSSVNDDLIQAILLNTPEHLGAKTDELVKMALQVDSSDNITAVLAKIGTHCQPTAPITAMNMTLKTELPLDREIRTFIRNFVPAPKPRNRWRRFLIKNKRIKRKKNNKDFDG
ncbi:serine/threonine-protein phosphatase [bacterium]|nr:serine/threonine-protein phosphatase [bacterium]